MNVKLNKAIGELPEVDDLFVFPSCGDETNALGAAWAFLADHGKADLIVPLEPSTSAPNPRQATRPGRPGGPGGGWEVSTPPDLEAAIADLLSPRRDRGPRPWPGGVRRPGPGQPIHPGGPHPARRGAT